MRFTATEAGFKGGLGGASNRRGSGAQHYIVFGIQHDPQHPDNSGIYFEWDDEANGGLDKVRRVSVTNDKAVFLLIGRTTITVESGVSATVWARFAKGIAAVFGDKLAPARSTARQSSRRRSAAARQRE